MVLGMPSCFCVKRCPAPALCRCHVIVLFMPFVLKRPASALSSVRSLAEVRHAAGLNGVRTSIGKSHGCTPRQKTKAEILQEIKHKIVEGEPLLGSAEAQKEMPKSTPLIAKMEGGRNRSCTPEQLQAITHTGRLGAGAANLGVVIRDRKSGVEKLPATPRIIDEYKMLFDIVRKKAEELVAIKSIAEFRKRAVKLGLSLRNSRQKMRTKAEIINDYERKLIAAGLAGNTHLQQKRSVDEITAVEKTPICDSASSSTDSSMVLPKIPGVRNVVQNSLVP